MNLLRIDHINIVVKDLDAAVVFFEQIGLRVIAQKKLRGDWIDKTVGLRNVQARFTALQVPGAETVIELLAYDNPTGSVDPLIGLPNQVGYRHIAFCVEDIAAWYKRLLELGIRCFSEVQEVPNYREKKIVYFSGPEDIILELAQYPKDIS